MQCQDLAKDVCMLYAEQGPKSCSVNIQLTMFVCLMPNKDNDMLCYVPKVGEQHSCSILGDLTRHGIYEYTGYRGWIVCSSPCSSANCSRMLTVLIQYTRGIHHTYVVYVNCFVNLDIVHSIWLIQYTRETRKTRQSQAYRTEKHVRLPMLLVDDILMVKRKAVLTKTRTNRASLSLTFNQ